MIYKDISLAKEDLSWLLRSPTLISENSSSLSKDKALFYVESLKSVALQELKSFYTKLFIDLSFKELKFSQKIQKEFLPLLALVPQKGLCIVYEEVQEGFKVQNKNGIEVLSSFEEGSVFAPIVKAQESSKYTSSFEMFKKVAKDNKKVLLYMAAATFSINVLALGTSLYTMQVYDRVVPTGAISTLTALTIGVFIAMLLELVIKLSRSTVQDYVMKSMDVEFSNDIFNRFLKVRSDSLPRSVGTLSSQLQSYSSVRAFITSAALFLIIDLPFSFIFVAVMFVIGGLKMALIPIIFLFVTLIAGFFFKSKIVEASKKSSLASYKKMALMIESIENSENVKASGAGFAILNKWNALTHEAIDDDIEIKKYSDITSYVSTFLQQVSYISIVAFGSYLVAKEGVITMGALIAMTILSGRVLQPIAQLPNHFVQWGKAKLSVKDLDRIYALPSDNNDIARPLNPYLHSKDIRCSELDFSYYENQSVVRVDKLEIKQGEKVAILGAIGSGKSTFLKMLAGLYKPKSGLVYLNDIDMQLIKRDLLSETISYLPQNTKLFEGTLRDNLVLGLVGVSDDRIIEAAKLTGLIELINVLPNGLDTPVPEGGESVSGGQKQLIALTRILIANKDICLLDEPTASLDEGTEKKIIAMLKEKLKENQTMVVVTHKPVVLNMVDRIIVLTSKGIALEGKKDEVLQKLYLPKNVVVKGQE